jgi:acylaminoacyl-peptidase
MGGSYGGYMSGIMAARHASVFRCAILLNPVLNLPFMFCQSDIPEWVVAEGLKREKMEWHLKPEDYAELLRKSPMLSPAQIPVLVLVGEKDKRVPWQSAVAYVAQAKAAGTEALLYTYQESDHRLADSLGTEFDVLLRIITYIESKVF